MSESRENVTADVLVAYDEVRLRTRDLGVSVVRAGVSRSFRVSFCSRVTVNVQLFDHSEGAFGVFVLVSFHMVKGYPDRCTLGCCVADGCINVVVIGGSVVGAFTRSCSHLRDIG